MAKPKRLPNEELDALIDALIAERPAALYRTTLVDTTTGPSMLGLGDRDRERLVERLVRRATIVENRSGTADATPKGSGSPQDAEAERRRVRSMLEIALRGLLSCRPTLSEETLHLLATWVMEAEAPTDTWYPLKEIVGVVATRFANPRRPPGDALKADVQALAAKLQSQPQEACRREASWLSQLIRKMTPRLQLTSGEAWSDAALADLAGMEPERRAAWDALLIACQERGAGRPTAKWFKAVKPLLDAVGREDFKAKVLRWFPLVDKPRTRSRPRTNAWEPDNNLLIEPHHVALLKGLAWCAGLEADRDLARALAGLALSSYRRVPGKGWRQISLGHAAAVGLGSMPGMDAIGQLAVLKLRIKFIPAQEEAEKALDAAAKREGLPREEIEELAVPSYGMEEVGRRVETLGDYTAELVVDGPVAHLHWSKGGKPIKSVPAAARKEHAEEVKELQAAVKDVGKMLAAQRERIDRLFLARKSWPFAAWRERYLDHPLVGAIARRLIWTFEADGMAVAGAWLGDRLVGVDDRPLEGLGEGTSVALWHPIDRTVEEITAWRDWFDRHRIRQPFKQAYREVYVLTDAERNTRVYSNRFAAHVLRQHQYHALCAARGWRNRLRMMVDDTYPATSRDLPEWGLRAEFWVEGAGDQMMDSGAYQYLSTDQVRFYEVGAPQLHAHAGGGGYSRSGNRGADAEPVPLERIPPLVLSEILRDVDLFVGVASVGNDPNWGDGGPDGRYVDYWQGYSFGDLTANGKTRKAVLERLIPRLKIAPRCSFADKFLVVRGDLRTYKIHLGSGNILMEPNDQYLCIVPKRGPEMHGDGVFLPFEGDNVLSIILSKALMLADDKKITDSTITSQIGRG